LGSKIFTQIARYKEHSLKINEQGIIHIGWGTHHIAIYLAFTSKSLKAQIQYFLLILLIILQAKIIEKPSQAAADIPQTPDLNANVSVE